MIDFFGYLFRALFTNALVSALLCGPLWGLMLLIFLGLGRASDPWPYLLVAFAGTYFLLMAWTTMIAIRKCAYYWGEKLGGYIWEWLLP